jgi:hypothetical protein
MPAKLDMEQPFRVLYAAALNGRWLKKGGRRTVADPAHMSLCHTMGGVRGIITEYMLNNPDSEVPVIVKYLMPNPELFDETNRIMEILRSRGLK